MGPVAVLALLAATSGLTVGNVYLHQPLLADMAASLDVGSWRMGLVPTLSQVGYAAGLLFLVPLADLVERRLMLLIMLTIVVCALVTAAISPGLAWLAAATLVLGFFTVLPQVVVPLSAELANKGRRGIFVGIVTSGLVLGIVGAQTASGLVGALVGWRTVYLLAAGVMVGLGIALLLWLPRSWGQATLSYPQTLASLPQLFLREPILRQACLSQAMFFGAFSCFWATLTFLLASPSFGLGSGAVGIFGLTGIMGAMAAPLVGVVAERCGPKLASGISLACAVASYTVLMAGGAWLLGIVFGAILLSAGTQANQVANQTRIFSLESGGPGENQRLVYDLHLLWWRLRLLVWSVGLGSSRMARGVLRRLRHAHDCPDQLPQNDSGT